MGKRREIEIDEKIKEKLKEIEVKKMILKIRIGNFLIERESNKDEEMDEKKCEIVSIEENIKSMREGMEKIKLKRKRD